jgi:hypothetical protein
MTVQEKRAVKRKRPPGLALGGLKLPLAGQVRSSRPDNIGLFLILVKASPPSFRGAPLGASPESIRRDGSRYEDWSSLFFESMTAGGYGFRALASLAPE